MIDMSIDLRFVNNQLTKAGSRAARELRRFVHKTHVFFIEYRKVGVNNNSRRYQQKPMYRKRALLKNLKNRR